MLTGDETCEDGNLISSDGCDNCHITANYECPAIDSTCLIVCGNGVLN